MSSNVDRSMSESNANYLNGDRILNLSSTAEFLLHEFSEVRELQILNFVVFLTLYLITIIGNLLIIASVVLDRNLHTPMYFFLINLALIDIGTISVILPKSMFNTLINNRSISYAGCVAQVFFYFFFVATDLSILTIMARDRYVAICNPLQYEAIMNRGACVQMATTAWICCIFYSVIHATGTFSITFCSNIVDQFFCEIPKILKLSCTDLYLIEVGLLVLSCIVGFGCFIFIIVTYVSIFTAVFRIPSAQGRQKALSTCLPHLIVVSVLVFSGMFVYGRPPSKSSSDLDISLGVLYTIFPPLLNPFIYSMRNKEMRNALWKLLHRRNLSNRVLM